MLEFLTGKSERLIDQTAEWAAGAPSPRLQLDWRTCARRRTVAIADGDAPFGLRPRTSVRGPQSRRATASNDHATGSCPASSALGDYRAKMDSRCSTGPTRARTRRIALKYCRSN